MEKSNIVITCAPHLGEILAYEIETLGFTPTKITDKAVTIEGTINDTYVLNYCLRTANRVLYQIDEFIAKDADVLYSSANRIAWESWFSPDSYFSIDSFVQNNTINDNRFANLKLKDAIVDRFMQKYDQRPTSGPEHDRVVIFLHWFHSDCKVYADTSGETISKHGYRLKKGVAPMQETLAAAVIYAMGWDGESQLLNPMCGSGTLAIEAAMIKANVYPGRNRNNYGFMHLKSYDRSVWLNVKNKMEAKTDKSIKFKIIASDKSQQMVSYTKLNAQAAGVSEMLTFEVVDFRKSMVPETDKGFIVMNPEYGMRMGEEEKLRETYKAIGDFFKKSCKGYTGFIFTGNPELGKSVGLRPSQRRPFLNGKIESKLMKFDIYDGTKKLHKLKGDAEE